MKAVATWNFSLSRLIGERSAPGFSSRRTPRERRSETMLVMLDLRMPRRSLRAERCMAPLRWRVRRIPCWFWSRFRICSTLMVL